MKRNIFFLLLLISSLYSADLNPYNGYYRLSNSGSGYIQDTWKLYDRHCDSTNCASQSYSCNDSVLRRNYYTVNSNDLVLFTVTRTFKNSSGNWYCNGYNQRYYYTTDTSCPSGQEYNTTSLMCEDIPITCNADEIFDSASNSCVPLPVPDINVSNSSNGYGTVPVPQEQCVPQTLEATQGIMTIIGWDTTTNTCKAVATSCNPGYVYNGSGCVPPPENLEDIPEDLVGNTGDLNQACSGKYVIRPSSNLNFCNQCNYSLGYWRPPLGYEDFGLTCDHSYIEYACTTDYRLKRFVEVSCGDIIPTDGEPTVLTPDDFTPDHHTDTNTSSITDPNSPDVALVSELVLINKNITDTNKILEGASSSLVEIKNNTDSIKGIESTLNNISDSMNVDGVAPDSNGESGMIDSMFGDVNTAINGFKTDVDNAISELNAKKDLISNGFNLTATKSVVSNCPTSSVFDLGNGSSTNITYDYCEALTPFYPTGYLISYVTILFSGIGFIYLIIVGL